MVPGRIQRGEVRPEGTRRFRPKTGCFEGVGVMLIGPTPNAESEKP